ncbi:MAG: hypothetical protein WBN75_17460 [Verrucomicrobiia bacterium]
MLVLLAGVHPALAQVTNLGIAPAGYFRLLQSTNPPGMVLIPAGSFKIGNYIVNNFYNTATNDPDITDAIRRMCMCRRFTWT